jgi:hypothetical protein
MRIHNTDFWKRELRVHDFPTPFESMIPEYFYLERFASIGQKLDRFAETSFKTLPPDI